MSLWLSLITRVCSPKEEASRHSERVSAGFTLLKLKSDGCHTVQCCTPPLHYHESNPTWCFPATPGEQLERGARCCCRNVTQTWAKQRGVCPVRLSRVTWWGYQRNLSSRTMLQALNRMDDSTPLRRLRKVHERAERLLGQFPPIP